MNPNTNQKVGERPNSLPKEASLSSINASLRFPAVASVRQKSRHAKNEDSQQLNSSLPSSKLTTARAANLTAAAAAAGSTLPPIGVTTTAATAAIQGSSFQPRQPQTESPSPERPPTVPTCPLVALEESPKSPTSINIDSFASTDKLRAAPNLLMNGYEVPDFVESAGGLQALSFLVDHHDDIVTDMSSLNLAKFTLFSPGNRHGASRDKEKQENETNGKSVPLVQARIPKGLAARFETGAHAKADDDWYDLSSTCQTEKTERKIMMMEAEKEVPEASVGNLSSELLSDVVTPPTQAVQNESILMPTVHRRTRSSEESLNDSRSFFNRVVIKQETYADLQCFRAYEYVLSFFEDHGYQVDENRSSASSRSSQMSRRSSRNRIAVVHGDDFAPRSPRCVATDEERKAAFLCDSLTDMYKKIAQAYRKAGIPKAYLDALYIAEVHEGTRQPRPHATRHRKLKNDSVSLSFSDDEDEPSVRLRSTEVTLADFDVENAVQQAIRGGVSRGSPVQRGKPKVTPVETSNNINKATKANTKKRGFFFAKQFAATPPAGPAPKVGRPPIMRSSPYEFMLKVLQKNAVHFHYQHNAMSLRTYKFVRQSGNITINGLSVRLHTWDNKKTGYLVTGVFDRTEGYPKNYKDPCTNHLYAEELQGGKSTTFPVPEMRRQHSAVGARCAAADDGITLRGCSIVRQADVYSIFDGRVQGCQVPREARDFRRAPMHAAIQSLAHYRNLFPDIPSLFRILHPQDRYRYPVVNPVGGMYCVPLIINGASRLVKVDDYVPMDPTTGVFRCLTSSANELFPTLLEKALLKANGGGVPVALMETNTVMHQLCGWIPWTMRFSHNQYFSELYVDGMLRASEMWDHLHDMYRRGRIVMSFLTRYITAEEKASMPYPPNPPGSKRKPFATQKAYPVVDMISRLENREGRGSRRIRCVMLRDTTKDPTDSNFVPPVQTSLSEAVLNSVGYSAIHREAGVFCLAWDEVRAAFNRASISLNPWTLWNSSGPGLEMREATRVCCHGVYDMNKAGLDIYYQPQYHLRFSGVEKSTQVFLTYTPHTSRMQPVPWPCDGLERETVSRCSDEGYTVKMRVYEVTSLPSILQVQRSGDNRTAQTCTLDHCVGRRLTADNEAPFEKQSQVRFTRCPDRGLKWFTFPITERSEFNQRTLTVAFDVSPGTREYVVVLYMTYLHQFRLEEKMADLGYTLTLYSNMEPLEEENAHCVPCEPNHAVQTVTLEENGTSPPKSGLQQLLDDDAARNKPRRPTVAMHPIPPALDVNSRTVRGTWSRLKKYAHSVALNEEGLITPWIPTGPQYHLHLSQPDDFSIRLIPRRAIPQEMPAAAMKLLLVRKMVEPTTLLEGNVMAQCDVVMASRIFDIFGAELSTTSPHVVLLDRLKELVAHPLKFRQEYHAQIHVSADLEPRDESKEAVSLLFRYPDPSQTVKWLVLRTFAQGILISPEACRVSFLGQEISQDIELRQLLADARGGYTFDEDTGEWKAVSEERGEQGLGVNGLSLSVYIDVTIENCSPFLEIDFPNNEISGELVERLRDVVWSSMLAGGAQLSRTLRAIAHIQRLIRQSGLADGKIEYLLGIARGIADWCNANARRVEKATSTPPLMMSKLPAGDYIIIPCFSSCGPIGSTIRPKTLPITTYHDETMDFDLRVELLRQRVELKAIPGKATPVTTGTEAQCCYLDEYLAPT